MSYRSAFLLATLLCMAAAPPPVPKVIARVDVGVVTQDPLIRGRDGQYSTQIGTRSYWTFGDTSLTEPNGEGLSFFDNSLSWSSSLSVRNGIVLDRNMSDAAHKPTRLVPFTEAEQTYNETHNSAHCLAEPCGANVALWPGPIVYDKVSRVVVVPFLEIWRAPNYDGWKIVGSGLSTGTVAADGSLLLTRPIQNRGANATLMWGPGEIGFIDVSFIQDGYYYAYGDAGNNFTHNFVLARVTPRQVLQKAAWTYYAGNGVWGRDVSRAVHVFQGGAAGNSVFYNAYVGEWMAIYNAPLSNNLYYRVAAAPEGPWSDAVFLLQGKSGWQNTVDYAGRAHPEYSPDGGRTIYVSYAHTTGFLAQDLPLTAIVFAKPGAL